MENDIYKLLSSVAVMGDLYDNGKGIYDVLKVFILDTLNRNKLRTFRASEITAYINREYSFKLNDPVIKTCLKSLKLQVVDGVYQYSIPTENNVDVETSVKDYKNKTDKLFLSLFSYLEAENRKSLSESEKEVIKNEFCEFIMDNSNNDVYSRFFHQYLLSIEENEDYLNTIQSIREGMLVYEGIRYSSNPTEVGSWKTTLNLFLDTEMLFALSGYGNQYNSELCKDLLQYISEINRREKHIKLWYFKDTKEEFDNYFECAERIVRNLDYLDPTKEAMEQIVNGCSSPSDVQHRKTIVENKFKTLGLTIFDKNNDFYDSKYTSYNLESLELLNKYSALWKEPKDALSKSMMYLSNINKLRGGISNRGFENCNFIFLTATGRTLKLSSTEDFVTDGEVPLATSLSFLINRFWFKLNKGLGVNKTPRTIDMVFHAKQVLSSIISNNASIKYEEIKRKYENNIISKEEFYAIERDLKSRLRHPEEIDKGTISEEIDDIDKWNFMEIIESERKKRKDYEEATYKISELEEQKKKYINEKKTSDAQHKLEIADLQSRLDQSEKRVTTLQEAGRNMEEKLDNYMKTDRNRKCRRKIICVIIGVLLIVAGVIAYLVGCYYSSKWTNVITGVLTITGIIIGLFGLRKNK